MKPSTSGRFKKYCPAWNIGSFGNVLWRVNMQTRQIAPIVHRLFDFSMGQKSQIDSYDQGSSPAVRDRFGKQMGTIAGRSRYGRKTRRDGGRAGHKEFRNCLIAGKGMAPKTFRRFDWSWMSWSQLTKGGIPLPALREGKKAKKLLACNRRPIRCSQYKIMERSGAGPASYVFFRSGSPFMMDGARKKKQVAA